MNINKYTEDNINTNDERIKVIDDYNIKTRSNAFKQDLFFDDENHDYNKFFVNYHKTMSYSSNAKIKDDSEPQNKKNFYLNNSLEIIKIILTIIKNLLHKINLFTLLPNFSLFKILKCLEINI
jgi:hypothetical protein